MKIKSKDESKSALGSVAWGESSKGVLNEREKIRVVYDDPDGHDKLYRFVESIQEFFDLAAGLDIDYVDAQTRRSAEA